MAEIENNNSAFAIWGAKLNMIAQESLRRDYSNPRRFEVIAKMPMSEGIKAIEKAIHHPDTIPRELVYLLRLNFIRWEENGRRTPSKEIPVQYIDLSCCDSRGFPRTYMIDQEYTGRSACLRIAGNLGSPAILESFDMIMEKNHKRRADSPVVNVFGHTTCGLVGAAYGQKKGREKPRGQATDHNGHVPSENITNLVKCADIGDCTTIGEAERNNLLNQARRIHEHSGLNVNAFMVNVTEGRISFEQPYRGEKKSERRADEIIGHILSQNRLFMEDVDTFLRVTTNNDTQVAHILKVSDARSGLQVQSVSQLAFESAVHGKLFLDSPCLGSMEYWVDHVKGRRTVTVDSHYPDVIADRIDQMESAGVLTPGVRVFALLSENGLYTPVTLKEKGTDKIYGESLREIFDGKD